MEESPSTLISQNKEISKSEIVNSLMSNKRSKSANDIVRYDIKKRMKIVEQIVRDEESISMAKSSEFGTVSKFQDGKTQHRHHFYSLKLLIT